MNPQQQVIKYCDRIVELGIYGCIILIPLYFDIHLYSTFDLSKVGIMYLITLIMLTAWFVKMILTCNFRSIVTPITIPILAFWLSYIISTVFSINPMMSLIGTYKRYEGLCAITSYILQFFFVINFIDTREKFYRLMRAFLYTGFVGGVYGAIQHFGKDPLSWESFDPYRLISTFGNPVFFGGYILMVFMIGLGMYLRIEGETKSTVASNLMANLHKAKKKKKKQVESPDRVGVSNLNAGGEDASTIGTAILIGMLIISVLLASYMDLRGIAKWVAIIGIIGLIALWIFRVREILWVILYTACVATTWLSFLTFRISYAYWTTFLVYILLIIASILFFKIPKNFFGGALVYGASTVLMYYGFSFTMTRGAYIGMFSGILLFLILLGRKGIIENKKKLILLGIVVFMVFANFNLINQKTSVIKRFTTEIFASAKYEKPITEKGSLHEEGIQDIENTESLFPAEKIRIINIPIPGIKARFLTHDRLEMSVFNHPFMIKLPWRAQIWASAVEALLDKQRYFWLGIGPDTMGFIFPKYLNKVLPHDMRGGVEFEDRCHNDILDTMLNRGIIGLGIYIWLILAFFLNGIRYLKKVEHKERVLVIGLMAAVLGYLGQNLVSFCVTPLSSGYWLILGATMAAGRVLIPNPPKPIAPVVSLKNKELNWFLCSLIAIGVIYLLHLTVRAYRADSCYKDGTVYLARNDLDTAIAKYEQAVNLHPYEIRYRDELNRAYIEKARNRSDRKWAETAMRSAQDLLELAPGHSNAYFTLAIAYYLKGGDIEKAITYYKKAAEINPFSADAYNNMGVIFTSEKRLDEAIEAFKQAYRLNASSIASLDNLARIYINKDMLNEAAITLVEILKSNPAHSTEILNILGKIYFKQEKIDKVIRVCKEIVKQNPGDIIAHENLGSMYYKKGMMPEAAAEFETLLRIQPDNIKARQMLQSISR